MAMAWCGYSRKGRQYRASSGGGAAGWSVSTSIPYILWLRCSNKALRPFSRGVYGWVFCAKNWLLHPQSPRRHLGLTQGESLHIAQLVEPLPKRLDIGDTEHEKPYPGHLPRWLCLGGERRREQAEDECDDIPNGTAPHGRLLT